MSTVLETEEHQALRAAVAALGKRYGREYSTACARNGEHPRELWSEAGKLGYLGVNLPEEYGGGGSGMAELSIVLEELGAAGSPLLMMVVSPAICGTVIARFGTDDQKRQWLPGLADGSLTMAFGITEPDAGSSSLDFLPGFEVREYLHLGSLSRHPRASQRVSANFRACRFIRPTGVGDRRRLKSLRSEVTMSEVVSHVNLDRWGQKTEATPLQSTQMSRYAVAITAARQYRGQAVPNDDRSGLLTKGI